MSQYTFANGSTLETRVVEPDMGATPALLGWEGALYPSGSTTPVLGWGASENEAAIAAVAKHGVSVTKL